MHTQNEIMIQADPMIIYALAAQVEYWPDILPHYRWVEILAGDAEKRLVEMAARRDFFPVHWVAEQWLEPHVPRITFKHVGGVTTGMEVEWRFTQLPEGTKVEILHELELKWPIIGGFAAHRVIGPLFVANIAGKTLQRIKELAEAKAPVVTGATT
ncbi:MAG: SRPBCC family protein [Chloroflexia bacterium]|nr:SRPBCC family protein [Chloroflexia bacterium]